MFSEKEADLFEKDWELLRTSYSDTSYLLLDNFY